MPDVDPNYQVLVKRIKSLPTLPGVVQKICSMVESDETSTAEIAAIINTDQVLTAKVLRIVNSPFYGFPGRITTINHALVLLGFNVIKGIMISASVIDFMTKSISGLWEHSIGVATASGYIARLINEEEPEVASTAGLLHDLGKVILSVELQSECEMVLADVDFSNVTFYQAEKNVLEDIDHCLIGRWLADQWNMPSRLKEPIRWHHAPQHAKQSSRVTAIVHLADVLTRALQFGYAGDPFVPELSLHAMKILGLQMADLKKILKDVDYELEGLDTSVFF